MMLSSLFECRVPSSVEFQMLVLAFGLLIESADRMLNAKFSSNISSTQLLTSEIGKSLNAFWTAVVNVLMQGYHRQFVSSIRHITLCFEQLLFIVL